MFCSSCGNQMIEGANFCKQCGARMDKTESLMIAEKGLSLPQTLAISVTVIGGIGMFGIVFLIFNILKREIIPDSMVFLVFALCATLFLILASILQAIRLTSQHRTASGSTSENLEPMKILSINKNKFALPEQPVSFIEQPASVVERTTRGLDEVAVKRN